MGERVECTVEECDLDNERGGTTRGVKVTCGRCGHTTESFGTSERSIKRCLVLMRENCPEGEENFYVEE